MDMFLLERRKNYLLALFFIIIVAAGLRLYKLDQVPSGMSWDEAAIGYNGFSIATTHRDEWLHFMPISFQSFGDYKAPLMIYVDGIFTALFGLNLWAVRLPFALIGVLCVLGISFLINLLLQTFVLREMKTKTVENSIKVVTILSTAIFALSPWHIFFSRASFESGVALAFVIWGVVAFLYSLQRVGILKLLSTCFSVACFVASLYTYHSAKIFTPLLVLSLLILFRKFLIVQKKPYIVGFILGILLLSPLVYDSIWLKGATRLSQTSILSSTEMNLPQKIVQVSKNYFAHFSPAFLVDGETTTLRHGDGHWGVLFVTEFTLILGTLIWVGYKKFYLKDSSSLVRLTSQLILLGIIWLLIGFIPAAIGFEIPHANRALLSYPGFLIIEAVGLFLLVFEIYTRTSDSRDSTLIIQSILGVGIILQILFAISFFNDYFGRYAHDSVDAFSYGYKQVFDEIMPLEGEVDKIMFTSAYGQPYIYALFFRKTNPIDYHGGSLIKYEFPDKITVGDLMRKNALVIASPKEIDPSQADKLIIAPNGEVRFVIIRTAE